MILYNEALAGINVDLAAAALRDEVKWEVSSSQAPKVGKKAADDNTSLTSKALSRLNDARGNKHDGKQTNELPTIDEDVFAAKPVEKMTGAPPRFEPVTMDEYYRFK